jgi:hypothetical protein
MSRRWELLAFGLVLALSLALYVADRLARLP